MAYTKQEIIEAKVVSSRQFIKLKKCTRADGTFDYFVGYKNGVPFRWQYLAQTNQGGIIYKPYISSWASLGSYDISNSGAKGSTTTNSGNITNINLTFSVYNKGDCTGNGFSYIINLNNNLNLVPIYTYLSAGGADNNNVVQFYATKGSTNVISYSGSSYTYDKTNGIPMDYRDIDTVKCMAYTYDDSSKLHHRRGTLRVGVRFCQRIPGDSMKDCFHYFG